jgi:hypothetical protein
VDQRRRLRRRPGRASDGVECPRDRRGDRCVQRDDHGVGEGGPQGRPRLVLFDLGGLLDSLASRRYIEDPAARPAWWKPYDLPPELQALTPVPNSRFFQAGPAGRTDGGLFSLDGVHPTTIGYGIVARELVRIMNDHARVPFFTQDGTARAPASVAVDFGRVLASDTLIARPPRGFSSTLALIGWLDETVDWIDRVLQFP